MPKEESGTLADLGEFGLVDALSERFGSGAGTVIGPGDDAAALNLPAGQLVVSLDMLIQDRHFRLDWSSPEDVGHKAAAANLSDINAMGGRAAALLIGFGAPPTLDAAWATSFADGFAAEAALVGATVVGGDVTMAEVITVAVTALGTCELAPVRRAGARPGEVVAIAGRQGWAAAGFAVLGRGFRSPRAVVEAHRRPEPPYDAGPEAAALGATAMVDVSDGLLQDLGHVAAASQVSVDLDRSQLEVGEPLRAVGAALGVDPTHFVLTGGDDYCLAATFPADVELPPHWRPIGVVSTGLEPGTVTVDGETYEQLSGHQHFS